MRDKGKKEPVVKSINIEIVDNIPTYVFTGDWTGKDILNVRVHLYKEYRKYQRSVRREPLAKQEVSDDGTK